MKTLLTILGAGLLIASYTTISNARTRQLPPPQNQDDPRRSNYDNARDRDSSCFDSIGPDMYACSSHGG